MEREFITYAHRGASEYCPENTLLSFYTGVYMGANGIETDVQMTKDGVAVLLHDDTIERMMKKPGRVADYTYAELRTFPMERCGRVDYIITLDAFLECFSKKELTFAIELKGEGTEAETARLVEKYNVAHKCIFTSFKMDYLKKMHTINPSYRLGFLAEPGKIDAGLPEEMKAFGFYEICPYSEDATPENVACWHSLGLNVRAWGIANEEIMKKAYDNGVDGMTVNFPDKLLSYIK